jgi:AcrR family transcriptional regulator
MSDVADLTHIIPPQQERSTRFLMRVLEAAERILRRDGADGLTMPAVALEAGVSVGGIYRRFQTKQDLLRAIKDRHLSRSDQAMDAAMAREYASLNDVVLQFLTTLIMDSAPGSESLFAIIMEAQGPDPVAKARGAASEEAQRAAFARALQPFRGEIDHPDPDTAIAFAFSMAIATFMRRVKHGARSVPSLSWGEFRRQLARAMTGYLKGPAC